MVQSEYTRTYIHIDTVKVPIIDICTLDVHALNVTTLRSHVDIFGADCTSCKLTFMFLKIIVNTLTDRKPEQSGLN